MICVDVQNRLAAFLDGQLPQEDATALNAHVETCRNCAAEVESMRKVLAFVERCSPPAPTKDLRSAVRERMRALGILKNTAPARPLLARMLRYAAAVIVGVPLGLFILGLIESASPEPASAAAQEESLAPLAVVEFDELPGDSLGGAYAQLIANGR
jgi:anti-sigma factor (TIGR02949 family)